MGDVPTKEQRRVSASGKRPAPFPIEQCDVLESKRVKREEMLTSEEIQQHIQNRTIPKTIEGIDQILSKLQYVKRQQFNSVPGRTEKDILHIKKLLQRKRNQEYCQKQMAENAVEFKRKQKEQKTRYAQKILETNPELVKERRRRAWQKYYHKQKAEDPTFLRRKCEIKKKSYRKLNSENPELQKQKRREKYEKDKEKWKENDEHEYLWIKRNAKTKKRVFTLTKQEVNDICSSSCFYCGVKTNICVDRVDSRGGYIKDNVVPACKMCNFMKRDLHINHFLCLCNSIYKHQEDPTWYQPALSFASLYWSWEHFVRQCAKEGKDYSITKQEYTHLINLPCTYCGMPNCHGLDRIDPSGSYSVSNTQPLCGLCNTIKWTFENNMVLKQIEKIHALHNEKGTYFAGNSFVLGVERKFGDNKHRWFRENHNKCSMCRVFKPLCEFYNNSGGRNGKDTRCKECLQVKQ